MRRKWTKIEWNATKSYKDHPVLGKMAVRNSKCKKFQVRCYLETTKEWIAMEHDGQRWGITGRFGGEKAAMESLRKVIE